VNRTGEGDEKDDHQYEVEEREPGGVECSDDPDPQDSGLIPVTVVG
jgi:hypothetical protein